MKYLSDKQSATLTKTEFTSTLKYWWNNYLTEDKRQSVLNIITINPNIKNESSGRTMENQILEDVITTLIYNITEHFI